jgi:FKBP-type peptidyl-prolyl cis-trans isomerase 2
MTTLFFVVWCSTTNTIKSGDLISITYTATFSDWTLFDKNTEQEPLMFTVWSWQTIKWLDKAVVGMKIGKKKHIKITPEEWYGTLYDIHLIQRIGMLIFEKINITPTIGSIQQLDKLEWIVKWIESDWSGNKFVVFDINPRQTRDTITYTFTVLAKESK